LPGSATNNLAMVWDIFCRVIDNFGDIGVCWRLAAELGRRGQTVRLWTDDSTALAWMAPAGAPGVQLLAWTASPADLAPGGAVVEAFGCAPPDRFVARMVAAQPRPVWINLEYLSAEPYAARSHGLASPQFSGPGAGLIKWFFYPGFTAATGGLLQCGAGPAQAAAQDTDAAAAAARAWVAARGWAAAPGEQAVTVFCYDNPALPALLQALAPQPLLLRLPPGPVRLQLRALEHASALPASLRLIDLPCLPQPDFDRLLAAADLNLVRGEDSFVRAQCAASAPFVWQIYPQHDGAHGAKLEAFLDLYLAGRPAGLAGPVRAVFRAFNGLASLPAVLPDPTAWRSAHAHWRQALQMQADLCSQLVDFAGRKQA
jgi:uncharacterized repeat protein (TIGR03837 family)